MMKNIMKFEQWREIYTNYLMMKSEQKPKDYTYKGGDLNVTISTDKRNYRQITAGD